MSSSVSTKPIPKICSQTRFTKVLDVSGLSLLVIHIARPNRFFGASIGIEGSEAGTSGSTVSPFTNQLPLTKTCVVRFIDKGFSIMMGVVGTLLLSSDQKSFFAEAAFGLSKNESVK